MSHIMPISVERYNKLVERCKKNKSKSSFVVWPDAEEDFFDDVWHARRNGPAGMWLTGMKRKIWWDEDEEDLLVYDYWGATILLVPLNADQQQNNCGSCDKILTWEDGEWSGEGHRCSDCYFK